MSEKADIVTRLRAVPAAVNSLGKQGVPQPTGEWCHEAADKIECLRAENERLNSAFASAEAAAQREEKAHLATIDQRDAAEEFASQVYFKIVGESPQWSNLFGYEQALEDITDKFVTLLSHVKDASSVEAAALDRAARLCDEQAAKVGNDRDPSRGYSGAQTYGITVASTLAKAIRSLIPPSHSPAPAGEAED